MTQHLVDRVHQLAKNQPRGLEFCDRNNQLMISEDDDIYNNADNESYDPTEDDDATYITEVNDNEGASPTEPDNNATVE